MKHLLLTFIVIIGCSSFITQQNNPNIIWDKETHDFGRIKQNEIVSTNFTLKNLSKDTLIIENIIGSCGCIANKWTKQPIYPNNSTTITVSFDTKNKSGQHLKVVTVYTNLGAYNLNINAFIEKE